ncbi:MAG: hypothetical protein P1P87_16670 [Trueperaceae bacterium]|nr:hypothetical protein [Trueperaceae bacterium]
MLFLDGVGLGGDDPEVNPFARARTPHLDALAGGAWTAGFAGRDDARTLQALDTTFGVAGLPQSATGQAALLTGRDAVAAMGRPYGPWPGPTLARLLEAGGAFHDAVAAGGALLANGYPRRYLDALAAPDRARRRLRPPASVVAARAAGLALHDEDVVARGAAVVADLGFGDGTAPGVAPDVWARPLAALARDHALTYLDVWITDRVGHRADPKLATALVERVDAVIGALAARLDGVTLVVVSDHGNLEDAGSPRHTRAPVPLVALGPAAPAFAAARDLRDVLPALRRAWGLAPLPRAA